MHGSSYPTRSQVDAEIEDFRAKVSQQTQEAEKAQKKRESESIFGWTCIRWYLPNTRLLTKESLSMADLPDLPEKLSSDGVNKRIEGIVLHIMKNPNKYLKGYQNLKSIFGLFDEITAQIVARDSWKLIAFECSYGIILPFHYWLLLRTQQCMLEDEDISSFLMFGLLGVCIFSILSWLKYQINRLENEIQLTSRQTLLHLVYNQLIICDVYFLQNADNNVIHKLLYSEFEDFIEYPRNFVSLTSIILVFVFTAVFRIYSF